MFLSKFQEELSSCQCTTTLQEEKKRNEEMGIANSIIETEYAKRFAHGHWSFPRPGSEKKWCGTHTYKPNGKWDRVAEDMMLNFSESGHPVFRASSALERGD